MLAPTFIKEAFNDSSKPAAVWFRNQARGSLPGYVIGWDEHRDEMVSYVRFQTLDGSVLFLPFGDIYLSVMTDECFEEAKTEFKMAQQVKEYKRRQMAAELSGLA